MNVIDAPSRGCDNGLHRPAIPIEEGQYICLPDVHAAIGKGVAIACGRAERGIYPYLRRTPERLTRRKQFMTGRSRHVVLGLKEEDRSWPFSHGPHHHGAQRWRLIPAFRATSGIDGGAIGAILCAEDGFDAAERIAHRGDGIRSNERLLLQPSQRRTLVVQMICRQQPYQGVRRGVFAAAGAGRPDLVHDIGASIGTQALATSVWREECPAVRHEDRRDRIERPGIEITRGAAVIVEHGRKGARTGRLVEIAMQNLVSAGESDDFGFSTVFVGVATGRQHDTEYQKHDPEGPHPRCSPQTVGAPVEAYVEIAHSSCPICCSCPRRIKSSPGS